MAVADSSEMTGHTTLCAEVARVRRDSGSRGGASARADSLVARCVSEADGASSVLRRASDR